MASDIPQDKLYIKQGCVFMKFWPLTDADTGGVPDMTGWVGRCQIRDADTNALIVAFHSDRVGHSGWAGAVSFLADGNMQLYLPAISSKSLPLTSNAKFDVILTAPADGGTTFDWCVLEGLAYITPEVSTDV
jgi:hypothetical protein